MKQKIIGDGVGGSNDLLVHATMFISCMILGLGDFFRPGWLVLYAIVLFFFFGMRGDVSLTFDQPLEVEKGDTLYALVGDLSMMEKYKLKQYLKNNDVDTSRLEVGVYDDIVGDMTLDDFFASLNDGPSASVVKVTLLEGWSLYDVDDYLTEKGLIQKGEYQTYISNRTAIRNDFEGRGWYSNGKRSSDYLFLDEKRLDLGMEGILYPDTYHLDRNYPLIPQLVRLQLRSFGERIWPLIENEKNWYDLLIIASIVEKEERVDANRKKIAGVFFNRIDLGMRLGADISLCYGLKKGYEACTPEVIVQNLYDKSNLYNTRELVGLTPTPIVTPTVSSVEAVLHPDSHDDLFYLHDMQGRIYMAETNAGHERNKAKYLK